MKTRQVKYCEFCDMKFYSDIDNYLTTSRGETVCPKCMKFEIVIVKKWLDKVNRKDKRQCIKTPKAVLI